MSVIVNNSTSDLRISGTLTGTDITSFTVCGWFNRRSFDANWHVSIYMSVSGVAEFFLSTSNDGSSWLEEYVLNGGYSPLAGPSAVTPQWIFLAITYSLTSQKMYYGYEAGGTLTVVNAVNVDTGSPTPFSLIILGNDIYNEFFQGDMAYIRIWDTVLTAGELQSEYESATAVKTSDLYASWPLATSATATVDASGNGHTLTITGAITTGTDDPIIPGGGGSFIVPIAMNQMQSQGMN